MLNFKQYDRRGTVSEEALTAACREALPILHKAQEGEARYAESQGWLAVERWAGPEALAGIKSVAARIRAECDAFVLIGVGGSNNAARSVIEALQPGDGPEIFYAGNTLSPHALGQLMKKLQGRQYAIDCIAKNFETLEPGSSFRLLRQDMCAQFGAETAARRTVCTGTYGSTLEALCRQEGYTFVPFPTDIGGRFSALSWVGLLPMAVAGIDIDAVAKGAAEMAAALHSDTTAQNPALRYAALRNLYNQKGYKLEMLASFEPQFRWFYKWWIQLFAESEGKDGKGLFPVASEFSEELHSVGQYIQDGAPLLFETFLNVTGAPDPLPVPSDGKPDYFDYLNGKDFAQINRAAFEATLAAHSETLPCLVFELPVLDAAAFGQLFYFFEFAVYLSGEILGVDPFDQPGVEAYKQRMFRALGK